MSSVRSVCLGDVRVDLLGSGLGHPCRLSGRSPEHHKHTLRQLPSQNLCIKCLRPRLHTAVQVLVVVCQLGPTTSAGHVERLPETWQERNGPEGGQRLCLTSSGKERQSQRRRLQDLTVVTSSLRHFCLRIPASPWQAVLQ